MRVLDGCILLVDAVAGVQVQTLHVYKQVRDRALPIAALPPAAAAA